MAKIISVINLKGGVGKTTLTMMFGEFLATAGKRVLLIDMDSQTNLTTAMMDSEAIKQAEKAEATVYSYIDKRLLGEISASESIEEWIYRNKKHWFPCSNIRDILDGDKLMIIPSSVALAELDDRFLRIAFEYPKGKIMHWPVPYFLLHDLIQMILLKESFDFILIDCPPNLSIWTANAIVVSDYIIVPVIPEELSLKGLNLIENRVNGLLKGKGGRVGDEPDEAFLRELKKRNILKNKDPDDPFYGGNKEWIYGPEPDNTSPPGMFLGAVLNKVNLIRGSHRSCFKKIFALQRSEDEHWFGKYRPFYNWIGTESSFLEAGDYSAHPKDYWSSAWSKWGKATSRDLESGGISGYSEISHRSVFTWLKYTGEDYETNIYLRELEKVLEEKFGHRWKEVEDQIVEFLDNPETELKDIPPIFIYTLGRGHFIYGDKKLGHLSFPPPRAFPGQGGVIPVKTQELDTSRGYEMGIFYTLVSDPGTIGAMKLPGESPKFIQKRVKNKSRFRFVYLLVARCVNLVEEIFGVPIIANQSEVRKWARLKQK